MSKYARPGLNFSSAVAGVSGDPFRHLAFLPIVKTLDRALADTSRPIKMLEVGVWAGFSTVSWIAALQAVNRDFQIVAVDTWRPQYDRAHEAKNPHYAVMNAVAQGDLIEKVFRSNVSVMGASEFVEVVREDSMSCLPLMADECFDLISIDGDHRFSAAFSDLVNARRLLRVGGILVGDDLELTANELPTGKLRSDLESGFEWVDINSSQGYHPGVTAAVAELFGDVGRFNGLFWVQKAAGGGWCIPHVALPSGRNFRRYRLPLESRISYVGRGCRSLLQRVRIVLGAVKRRLYLDRLFPRR